MYIYIYISKNIIIVSVHNTVDYLTMLKHSPTTEQNDLLLQINKNCFKIPLKKIVISIEIPIFVAHAPIQVTVGHTPTNDCFQVEEVSLHIYTFSFFILSPLEHCET